MNNPLYQVRPIRDLKDMIIKSTELYGEKTAFLIKRHDNTFTRIKYNEYKADIDALGTAFVNIGLSGCKIALLSENRYEWCTAYLSVVNGTGIIVPLDKELPEPEIQNLITMSGACALIFSGKHEASIKKIRGLLPGLIHLINIDAMEDSDGILSYTKLIQKGYDLVNSGDRSFIDATVDNNVMNMLLYTSGTTGVAKGVMLSHTNICSDMMSVCSEIQINEADSSLSILPVHHTYESTCDFLLMIYNGCTLSFNEGLKHIAKNLKETKPTIIFLVPLILESMYKKIWDQAGKKFGMKTFLRFSVAFSDFLLNNLGIDIRKKLFRSIHENLGGRVRLVISGAAALNPDVSKGLRSFGIRVLQGYGMTECSPIISVNTDRIANDSSVGPALSCMEVKIENPNKEGIGEIVVKGPNVM
ncbi:MAG TPA: AMP-binding protein, partial [Clostridia bacterium]